MNRLGSVLTIFVCLPLLADAGNVSTRRPDGLVNLALLPAARAAASSVWANGSVPIHQIAHLNDGLYNNDHSWIAGGQQAWAKIDLGAVYLIRAVAIGSDHGGTYNDRAATAFDILLASECEKDGSPCVWRTVYRHDGPPVRRTTAFEFVPAPGRWVRIAIHASQGGHVRIDELEIYGDPDPEAAGRFVARFGQRPPDDAAPRSIRPTASSSANWRDHIRTRDENRRLQRALDHRPSSVLPLPLVKDPPALDGRFDEACWQAASVISSVVRGHDPDRPVERVRLQACRDGHHLFLAIQRERLVSPVILRIGEATIALRSNGFVLAVPQADPVAVPGALAPRWNGVELAVPLSELAAGLEDGLKLKVNVGSSGTTPGELEFTLHPSPMFARLLPVDTVPGVFDLELGLTAGEGRLPIQVSCSEPGKASSRRPDSLVWAGSLLADQVQRTRLQGTYRGPLLTERVEIQGPANGPYVLPLCGYDPVAGILSDVESALRQREGGGLDWATPRDTLETLRRRWRENRSTENKADADLLAAAYRLRRAIALSHPADPLGPIVFVERHIYRPSHIYTEYSDAKFRPGGGLFILDPAPEADEPRIRRIFDGSKGICRDPDVSFDGTSILFAYRAAQDEPYHIYRINADGTGLTQLTDGPFHDTYPCHLPDGRIAFISTRCKSRVLCFIYEAATLFAMDGDGKNIEPLSANNVNEWSPAVLPDGRILYTRWEYMDKGADYIQSLWAINPDGTGAEQVFGNNLASPYTFISAQPIGETGRILSTVCSHWGDHVGPIVVLDPARGMNNLDAIENLTPEYPITIGGGPVHGYRDPYPLSSDTFLVSYAPEGRFGLYLVDGSVGRELIWAEKEISCFQPRPLRARPVPPVRTTHRQSDVDEATVLLVDVYRGLGEGTRSGQARYIQIAEEVRHDLPLQADGTYRTAFHDFRNWYASPWDEKKPAPAIAVKRIFGTVPVESDGSAHFRVPSDKPIYFQVLDENFNELQRMKSYIHFKPGEVRSCIGCHEPRTEPPRNKPLPIAARRRPSRITPPPWGQTRISYMKLVQPLLEGLCVRCHGPDRQDGQLDLSSRPVAPGVPASYKALVTPGPEGREPLVSFYDNWWGSRHGVAPGRPLVVGTLASPLIRLLDAGHAGIELTPEQRRRITAWIDMNCPLTDQYGHLQQARR